MKCACAILSSVACLAVIYFSTFSHKWIDFPKIKNTEDIKCVFRFSLQISFETSLILRRTERDTTKRAHLSSNEVPLILVIF